MRWFAGFVGGNGLAIFVSLRPASFFALPVNKMKRFKLLISIIAIAAVLGAGYWYLNTAKEPGASAAKAAPVVPVVMEEAETGDIPVLLNVIGRAEAYESVTVKSRLDGQVLSVAYTEGQHVNQGDVLVKLDPGDFNARVLQAEANVAKDQAQLAKARADVERYVSLKARGFVSDEKVNEVRTAEAAAGATVKADQAGLELARLQLSYATIKAPFAGVVGARLVFPGSSVKLNETALAVVNCIRPIYVTFSVPEKHIQSLRRAMSDGPMKVFVTLPGSTDQPFEGSAKFIDNAVDATTGTIVMKAVLENRGEKLTPGQFLKVSMTLDTLTGAVLAPAAAVQQGTEGNFLYVVKADNTVEVRKVEILTTHLDKVAISKGVMAGETVVTDGQLRLSPGAQVQSKSVPSNQTVR